MDESGFLRTRMLDEPPSGGSGRLREPEPGSAKSAGEDERWFERSLAAAAAPRLRPGRCTRH